MVERASGRPGCPLGRVFLPTSGVAFQVANADTNVGMAGQESRSTVNYQILRGTRRNEDLVVQASWPVCLSGLF